MNKLAICALLGAVAVGCPSSDPETGPAAAPVADPEGSDAVLRVQSCEPRTLLPAGVRTDCGAQVLTSLFAGLVELDPGTGKPSWGRPNDRSVARQITTVDAQTWIIQLEEDWQFHDGEPVTARSFVDAWNDAALGSNPRAMGFLFRDIVGFDQLQCQEAVCDPTRRSMRGLRVLDPHTLVVSLSAPDSMFPRRLGHLAFSPLPRAAFEDLDAFVEQPIGNGPFRMDGAWEHDRVIRLVRNEDFAGLPAIPERVELRLEVGDPMPLLLDGALDILTKPPVPADELPAHVRRVTAPGDDYTFLVAPAHRPRLSKPALLKGLSMAIDRAAIVEEHLDGRAEPARGLIPPIASSGVDRCGLECRFDLQRARRAVRGVAAVESGIEVWYDGDSAAGWVGALLEGWRRAFDDSLGPLRARPLPHQQFVGHLQDRRVDGLYVLGWSMDVPSPGEYLGELHGQDGLVNLDGYGRPGVHSLFERARRLGTDEAGLGPWFDLERAIMEDWHHIPLWNATHEVLVGTRVAEVALDGNGRVILADVRVTE